jgi:signal transduction histidine kinase/DNA-binding response OmpR family regulator
MSERGSDTSVAILLVDDDERNLLALEAMLSDLDLLIITSSSADDALRQVLLHEFALILLDVRMPGMDGVELAAVIRSRERTRRVPIIFLTGYDHDHDLVARGYGVGAVDFLFKPPLPAALRSKVQALVDLHRKTKEVELQAEQLRAAERDAHERRLAEFRASIEAISLRNEMAASRRMNERLQLLAGVATELLFRTDPIEAVDTVARFIHHLGYEICIGYQLVPETRRLRLLSVAGARTSWQHPTIELDDSAVMRTVFVDCVRYVVDASSDEPRPAWLADLGLSACAAFPILTGGKALGMLLCGRRSPGPVASEDLAAIQVVCDQIALATERDQLMNALREHADALSDAHRRKDEFLAMLAHELRNPLAPMRYALDMLQAGEHRDETRALHDVLQRQLSHLSRMVDDLLDVSRITSGKIELELENVSIQHAMLQALETSRPQLDKHSHHVEVELPQTELVLRADTTRLTQVIANLLNNAARYTDPGGHISIRAHRDGARVVLEVRDDGRGIPGHMLPRVFDLFVQAERTRDRSQGGLGLGLTLVRRLVEMHGGTVSAASEGLDKGSTFTVTLPLAEQAHDVEIAPAKRPSGTFPVVRRSGALTILVVEDNEDSRDLLQLLLEARGHHVDVAADGTSGLAQLLEQRHDVALLDIGLPGVDGYELVRRLREQRPDRSTRLIAITGYGQGEDRARALAAGFDEHLVKPVSVVDLERVLPSD